MSLGLQCKLNWKFIWIGKSKIIQSDSLLVWSELKSLAYFWYPNTLVDLWHAEHLGPSSISGVECGFWLSEQIMEMSVSLLCDINFLWVSVSRCLTTNSYPESFSKWIHLWLENMKFKYNLCSTIQPLKFYGCLFLCLEMKRTFSWMPCSIYPYFQSQFHDITSLFQCRAISLGMNVTKPLVR